MTVKVEMTHLDVDCLALAGVPLPQRSLTASSHRCHCSGPEHLVCQQVSEPPDQDRARIPLCREWVVEQSGKRCPSENTNPSSAFHHRRTGPALQTQRNRPLSCRLFRVFNLITSVSFPARKSRVGSHVITHAPHGSLWLSSQLAEPQQRRSDSNGQLPGRTRSQCPSGYFVFLWWGLS